MKATLYADLRVLWSNAKMLIVIAAFLAVLAISTGEIMLIGVGIVLISVSLPLSLCTTAQYYGWDKLQLTTPIDKKTIAYSHFALGLMPIALFTAIGLVAQGILCMVHSNIVYSESVSVIFVMVALSLALGGAVMWASIRFGTERARYILIIIALVPTLGVMALQQLQVPMPDLSWIDRLNAQQGAVFLAAALCVALGIYVLFGLLAARTMQKKEF